MGSTLTFMLTETELHSHPPTHCTVWGLAARFGFLSCHHALKVADLVQARRQVQLVSASNGWHVDIPTPNPVVPPVVPTPNLPSGLDSSLQSTTQAQRCSRPLQLVFVVLVGYCQHTHSVWLLSGLGSSANSTGSKLELRPDQQTDRCNWRWQPIPSHNG